MKFGLVLRRNIQVVGQRYLVVRQEGTLGDRNNRFDAMLYLVFEPTLKGLDVLGGFDITDINSSEGTLALEDAFDVFWVDLISSHPR